MTHKNDSSNSKQLDELLAKTGELVWQADPLVKGSNICHGTSGNGYAFFICTKDRETLFGLIERDSLPSMLLSSIRKTG